MSPGTDATNRPAAASTPPSDDAGSKLRRPVPNLDRRGELVFQGVTRLAKGLFQRLEFATIVTIEQLPAQGLVRPLQFAGRSVALPGHFTAKRRHPRLLLFGRHQGLVDLTRQRAPRLGHPQVIGSGPLELGDEAIVGRCGALRLDVVGLGEIGIMAANERIERPNGADDFVEERWRLASCCLHADDERIHVVEEVVGPHEPQTSRLQVPCCGLPRLILDLALTEPAISARRIERGANVADRTGACDGLSGVVLGQCDQLIAGQSEPAQLGLETASQLPGPLHEACSAIRQRLQIVAGLEQRCLGCLDDGISGEGIDREIVEIERCHVGIEPMQHRSLLVDLPVLALAMVGQAQ